MELRQRKRPRTEIQTQQADVETISNRTILVLYLTCVHHPYLFPLLRQLCKASRDDKELEIEFLKYSKGYKRSINGLKHILGRLVVNIDSISIETLMDYMTYIIASKILYLLNEYKASEVKKSLLSPILTKMRGSEKHEEAFEGRVRCHYHSLEKCAGAFQWACSKDVPDIVRLLLCDPRVDPSVWNQQAIQWASREGHIDIVHLLLADPRVDPSAGNQYAIREASVKGRTEIIRMLLADPRVDPSIDPSACRIEAIFTTARTGNVDIFRMLLVDPRVDPSANNQEAIRMATQKGHTEVVRMLLVDPRVKK